MNLDEKQQSFIRYLLSLAREGKEDRGALADLRSGLGKAPGQMTRVHRHVVPYLPEQNRSNDRWYYLTATLFGLCPEHRKQYSLGKAFRALREKSESMDHRFTALLNADAEDLGNHLRHAISLLKANDQPLDWYRLFADILQWDHPEGYVQLRWARDYYAGTTSGQTSGSEQAETIEGQEEKEETND